MAVKTTYALTLLDDTLLDGFDGSAAFADNPDSVALGNGGYATAADDFDTTDFPDGQVTVGFYDADGIRTGLRALDGSDPSIALLASGYAAVVATTPGGEIICGRMKADGTLATLTISAGAGNNGNADVAARPATYGAIPGFDPGGFAAVWQRDFGGGDSDIIVRIFDDDNGSVAASFNVDASGATDRNPSVAYLSDGGIVVAWDRTDPSGDTAIWYAVYERNGSTRVAPTEHDTIGHINREPSVAAYADGFTISYEDSESGGSEIAVFNRAPGTGTDTYVLASASPGTTAGQAASATVGGLVATAFTQTFLQGGEVREQNVHLTLTDPLTGAALTDPAHPFTIATGLASEPSVADLGNGRIVVSYNDQDDGHVHQQVRQVVETITGDGAGQTLSGRSGGIYLIDGAGGNDSLYGGHNADRLLGNTGDDLIQAFEGDDYIDGGAGTDTLYVPYIADLFNINPEGTFTINLSLTGAQNTGAGMKTIRGIENLTGYSTTTDILTGNAGANVLDGGGGSGGASPDRLSGGLGNDTYIVGAGTVVIESSASGGTDLVKSHDSFTLPTNVENLILLADAEDAAGTGNAGANGITGNAFANRLDGKAGADVLTGLGGSDTYLVDNAGDRVIEAANGGTDRVLASVSYALAAGQSVEQLSTVSISARTTIDLTGNEMAQSLSGNAGANKLDGKGGADTMSGYGGNDLFTVDVAGDRVIEAADGGTDKVLARVSYTLAAGTSVEQLSTVSIAATTAIDLTGNEIAQTLYGNAGANKLDGKAGADTLYGYGGRDSFVFSTALSASNVDRLKDFSHADDTIRLAKDVFSALSAGTLNSGAFKDLGVSGATLDGTDRILYDHRSGALSYDADGSGATAAVRFALLDTKPTDLNYTDFLIV